MPISSCIRFFVTAVCGVFMAGIGTSGLAQTEQVARVDGRFAMAGLNEVPDFQKHVSPLLGRVGCNGRACHGSFQGQGGLRLSLFGYDFDADHQALLAEGSGRIDLETADESLILTKPTDAEDHGGGERFKPDSWQYNLLKAWITNGAKNTSEPMQLVKLDVQPARLTFAEFSEQTNLKVTAVWADGTGEDVTPLCRFQSNDPSVVEVNPDGHVTSGGFGDSHIVVFYDNGVATVPVMRPFPKERMTASADNIGESNPIDRLVGDKLRAMNLQRSELADDVTFLRRVSLDIAGTLPTPGEVRAFLEDKSPEKRQRKIDELLETPAYVAWQTTFLCDITGNNSQELRDLNYGAELASQQWYDWIKRRVETNTSYDKIVEGIVLSKSRSSEESYYDYCSTMSEMVEKKSTEAFANRDVMPYYWMRRDNQDRDTRAIAFAQNFLGLQIQCAQCHKHPFDRWSQKDFEEFSRFFTGIAFEKGRPTSTEDRADMQKILEGLDVEGKRLDNKMQKMIADAARQGQVVPFPQVMITKPKIPNDARKPKPEKIKGKGSRGPLYFTDARLLGENRVSFKDVDDVREPLMAWVKAKENPFFARAYVNRIWARYFGVGIVNPIDDLNLANPASNEPLLDYLATQFVERGYDMKWLHREIANSRTYQTSWQPNESNSADRRNFSHAYPRRLPAELVVDAMVQASSNDSENEAFLEEISSRATALPGTVNGRAMRRDRNNGFALDAFGRSTRNNNCDCDRSNETSLIQTVYLQNDRDVHFWIGHPQSWVSQTAGVEIDKKVRTEMTNQLAAGRQQLDRMEKQREKLLASKREVPETLIDKIAQIKERIATVQKKLDGQSNLAAVADQTKLIEEAYLRTLSRFPTSSEIARCESFIAEAKSLRDGLAGVMWTLLNTKEFIVNH
ncbi:MAG: DUF1549 and DUF1553 domain-containing protein [Pirellulaceae bacterium]